jgi:DNA repair exonuclease SbcCD ATPase subunit
MMGIVMLAGAMLAGCDYKFPSYTPKEVVVVEKTPPQSANYLEDLVEDKHAARDANTAVDIAARLSEKYGQSVEKLNALHVKHQTLMEKDKASQVQISKLQGDLARAEKELTEANTVLVEMREELTQWKKDILGYRSEMRESQKVLIEGVTRLHVLMSGGVAPERSDPKTPLVVKTEEKTGANLK